MATWLERAYGGDPEKPRAAMSPAKRQELKRHGVELSQVREQIKTAWAVSDSRKAFEKALEEHGLSVSAGDKKGVWIVSKDAVDVGALDRLTGQKRAAVKAKMEVKNEQSASGTAVHRRADQTRHGADPHAAARARSERGESVRRAEGRDSGSDHGRAGDADAARSSKPAAAAQQPVTRDTAGQRGDRGARLDVTTLLEARRSSLTRVEAPAPPVLRAAQKSPLSVRLLLLARKLKAGLAKAMPSRLEMMRIQKHQRVVTEPKPRRSAQALMDHLAKKSSERTTKIKEIYKKNPSPDLPAQPPRGPRRR
ncbi:hypothetical protein [Flexibacterium corallicola]|uniref:hypothetical protein n=1 Tax=Flexibacterium corallicola TaxID=3037259 RepID=UPI00386217C2